MTRVGSKPGKIIPLFLSLVLLVPLIHLSARTTALNPAGTGMNGSASKLAADLEAEINRSTIRLATADRLERVIIQPAPGASSAAVGRKVGLLGGHVYRTYKSFNLLCAEMPLSRVRELAADTGIARLSPDRQTSASGLIETTTGTAQIRQFVSGLTLDGSGIGIAVIDSGIYSAHNAFTRDKGNAVITSRDFTGAGVLREDYFGHGSHVATLAGGNAEFSSGSYTGIAPKASLLNLRVLDRDGKGQASEAIAAIDWCIQNKAAWNIRVINLSLGTRAVESYKTDPLCLAVRRAALAGIVVVCAAGNDGKDTLGRKLYGGIHSPGIDPSVITVGAANTLGTTVRSDDVVTTYSSRGPTRGYYADPGGVKHYDNLIKPDLIAPGNRLIAAQSDGMAYHPNTLIQLYPALDTGLTAVKAAKTMYLSGTSMAAPVVAGAAALLLQLNPTLTPNLVKAILMYTAQPLQGFNTLEQGAGLLNVDGAIRLARIIRPDAATLSNGDFILTVKSLPGQMSLLAGETCWWGQGVITNYCFLYGSRLMSNWQGMYSSGIVMADATSMVDGRLSKDPALVSASINNSNGVIHNTGIVMADGSLILGSALLADGIVMADGQPLIDGVIIADGIVMADGLPFSDTSIHRLYWTTGDITAAMPPCPNQQSR